MKKLLLLGGSAQQVIAIETAKKLGYYTVLCDFLPDNPGQHAADKFYLTSTTDKDAVLEIAREEQISGIVAYATDPAAPTAAYVAQEMGLPGNPYDAVLTLCNKDMFRLFLKENEFQEPDTRGYSTVAEAIADSGSFRYPIIIKPTDSSGSKGVTILKDTGMLQTALEFAFSFSRCHRIVVERFVEKNHPYLIGGDIFVENGQVVLWGLMNCHRDPGVNPLVPVGKSYPPMLSEQETLIAKETLQRLVTKLGFRSGAMNVELVIDSKQNCWLLDIGPRNGGNMIPDLLGYIFGIDVVEATVRLAMGESTDLGSACGAPFYATHNIHTDHSGEFDHVWFSPEIAPYVIRKCVYKQPGDRVEYFDNAAKAVGIVFLKFEDQAAMYRLLGEINRHIKVVCRDGNHISPGKT